MKKFENLELKNVSWVKIGGVVPEYIEVENNDELISLGKKFFAENKKFEVIGWSCNTLFADEGLESSVLKLKTNGIEIGIDKKTLPETSIDKIDTRHKAYKDKNISSGFDTDDLDYEEFDGEEVIVKVDSGVALSYLINFLIEKEIVGLQFFGGIPSSVGAAAINNIHGGPKSFSTFVYTIEVLDENGELRLIPNHELEFDYDYSNLQHTSKIVTSVYLSLRYGDKTKARNGAIEWTKRKATQPKNSLGSAFHNLTKEVQEKLQLPTPSTAYFIEHKLGLSGFRVGNIMIPEKTPADQVQVNKNIIMNLGDGTAEDYFAVLDKVWTEAYEKFGVKLKTEIHFKGFDKERIRKFLGEES